MELGAPRQEQPADPVLADGLRWCLGAVLVVQVFFQGLAPSLLVTAVWTLKALRGGQPPFDVVPWISGSIPWLVYLAAHLTQLQFLRRVGSYPYSNLQVAFMALLPGYNLYGSVELFASQGEAMERKGVRPGLGLELRAAAAMASALAVAQAVLAVRWLAPFVAGVSAAPEPTSPGMVRSAIILALALLLTRLYVLARLQIATRDLASAQRSGALPAPVEALPSAPGLPGARNSIAVIALALAAGAYAYLFSPSVLPRGSTATLAVFQRAPLARAAEPEKPALAETPVPAAEPAKPKVLPPGYLLGGRPVDWWRDRLRTLRVRDDDAGRELYNLTRVRASMNGLIVSEREGQLEVEPSPELITAANAEVVR